MPIGGPWIQAACFCDMAIQDTSGAFSLIRLIDTIVHGIREPKPPIEMPAFRRSLNLMIMIKAGDAKGRSELKITPELPNGSTSESFTYPLHFEGEEKGCNSCLHISFEFPLEGLYWFNISINNTRITSVPLRIRYEPIAL